MNSELLQKLLEDDKLERLVVAPSTAGFTAEAIIQTGTMVPYDPSTRTAKMSFGSTKSQAVANLIKTIYGK